LTIRGESFFLTGVGEGRSSWLPERLPGRLPGRLPLGTAFTVEYSGTGGSAGEWDFLVFPLLSGGTSVSCGFLINSNGRVERIIPLGTHSEQAFERLPQGILDVYIRRIEGGVE
jgi:hypothetical protein